MVEITTDLIITVLEEHWERVCGESVPAEKRVKVQNWKSYFGIRTLIRHKLRIEKKLTEDEVRQLNKCISTLVDNNILKERTARTGRSVYKLKSLIDKEAEIAEKAAAGQTS